MASTLTAPPVIIAGGGIAGLSMALTCHQIGVPALVLESARQLKPLGVGINLQPNAIRELYDLGLEDLLPTIGIEATEWALVGRNGNDIWSEPRGTFAGYRWPQFSVHRGKLQMALHQAVVNRLGPDAVQTASRVTGWTGGTEPDSVDVLVERRADDGSVIRTEKLPARLLLAADGIHSAVRSQMHPGGAELHWNGALLWRGTAMGPAIRSGAAFTAVGSLDQRFIHYPISQADPETGLHLQNWIAELTVDTSAGIPETSWEKHAQLADFISEFEDWNFDWLDCPGLIRSAERVWEFPMIDRDPVPHWVDGSGRVCLLGDAAHVMYPVGSNGGSQAIVDARVLGAKLLEHGVGPDACAAFQDEMLEKMNALVLRNRGAGPLAILGTVDERCGGVFDDINDVIPRAEVEDFMARYKAAAGFAIETLNAAPPTIAPGAGVSD